MSYHRYAHLSAVKVKVGDSVSLGDKIGEMGGTGGWLSHLHYDVCKYNPGTTYIIGWSKAKVQENYINPHTYISLENPTQFDHLGYDWLDWIGNGYHPGIDINGPGGGNADLGNPIYSTTDGVVEYIYNSTGLNGGWGKMIIIKENKMSDNYDELFKRVSLYLGKDYGDNLDDKDIKDIMNKLQEKKDAEDIQKETIDDLEKTLNQLRFDMGDLVAENSILENEIEKLKNEEVDEELFSSMELIKILINRLFKK